MKKCVKLVISKNMLDATRHLVLLVKHIVLVFLR